MNYIVDIILAVIFVLTIIISAKKGFFATLFELAAYVVSMIAAKVFSASLAPTVFDQIFRQSAEHSLANALGDAGTANYSDQIESFLDKIPGWANGIMDVIGVNKENVSAQLSQIDLSGKNAVETIMNKIVTPVGIAVIQTILFVIIAFVLMIVLRFVVKLLNKFIKKLPAVKQINSGLGAVLGAVKGVLLVIVLALIIGLVSNAVGSSEFADSVDNSLIIKSIHGLLTSISGYVA